MEVKCPRCSYVWNTKTKMFYATCPRCRKLFPVREVAEDEKDAE